jgi:phage tail-like protein
VTPGGADRRSSYLKYLPEVVWSGQAAPDGFSVEVLLRVAETILSGIDRDPVAHGGHTHDGIEALLDRLPLLFDPLRVPLRYLPWLGGWLGVEPSPTWEAHQQRRAVAGSVRAMAARGSPEGLLRTLEHYRTSGTRPRIALDEGARILFSTPTPGRAAPVHTLLGQGPYLHRGAHVVVAAYPGLTDPGAIAGTPDGHLLLGDSGTVPGAGLGLWRISRTGAYLDVSGAPPVPRPLGAPPPEPGEDPPEEKLDDTRALVVEGDADRWDAYVLDTNALFRFSSTDPDTLTRVAFRSDLDLTDTDLSPLESDAVVLDGPGHLMVVDRGGLVAIDLTTDPPVVAPHRGFTTADLVPGPLVTLGRHLVVADRRAQVNGEDPDMPADFRPADLVLIDRSHADPALWTERRLLADPPPGGNPLVTPVALAMDGPAALLVLDLGLRPQAGEAIDPTYKVLAEPAAVYRVDLAHTDDPQALAVTGVERVTELGRLVRPNGMVVVAGTVYISDPGQLVGEGDDPLVRNRPGHLALQVHFSRRRPADPDTGRTRRRIAHDIASIVEGALPASVLAGQPQVSTDTQEGGTNP